MIQYNKLTGEEKRRKYAAYLVAIRQMIGLEGTLFKEWVAYTNNRSNHNLSKKRINSFN
jgi:hypothetical protein